MIYDLRFTKWLALLLITCYLSLVTCPAAIGGGGGIVIPGGGGSSTSSGGVTTNDQRTLNLTNAANQFGGNFNGSLSQLSSDNGTISSDGFGNSIFGGTLDLTASGTFVGPNINTGGLATSNQMNLALQGDQGGFFGIWNQGSDYWNMGSVNSDGVLTGRLGFDSGGTIFFVSGTGTGFLVGGIGGGFGSDYIRTADNQYGQGVEIGDGLGGQFNVRNGGTYSTGAADFSGTVHSTGNYTNDASIFVAGKIGVGTTSPKSALDVAGIVHSTGNYTNDATIYAATGLQEQSKDIAPHLTTSAATSGTVTASTAYWDETVYLSSGSTITSITIALPSSSTLVGQIYRVHTKSIVTTLSVTGGSFVDAAVITLTAGQTIAYQAQSTSGAYIRIQ